MGDGLRLKIEAGIGKHEKKDAAFESRQRVRHPLSGFSV
jgi:hypothetical protein